MHNEISLYEAMKQPDQPAPFFQALDELFQREIGHVLFTLLAVDGGRSFASTPQTPSIIRCPAASL